MREKRAPFELWLHEVGGSASQVATLADLTSVSGDATAVASGCIWLLLVASGCKLSHAVAGASVSGVTDAVETLLSDIRFPFPLKNGRRGVLNVKQTLSRT